MLVLGIRYASDMYFEAALLIALFGFVELGGAGQVPAARRGDRMNAALSLWVEAVVAMLLVASGSVCADRCIGLLRLHGFFLRMHAAGARRDARRVVRHLGLDRLLLRAQGGACAACLADSAPAVDHGAGDRPCCWRGRRCSASARLVRTFRRRCPAARPAGPKAGR